MKRKTLIGVGHPDDPEDIAEKINFLFENRNGLLPMFRVNESYISQNFSAICITRQLAALFDELTCK